MLLIISNQQLGIGSLTGPLQSSPPPSSLPFSYFIFGTTLVAAMSRHFWTNGQTEGGRRREKWKGGKKKGRKKLQMSLAFASQPAMWRRHTHGVLQNRQRMNLPRFIKSDTFLLRNLRVSHLFRHPVKLRLPPCFASSSHAAARGILFQEDRQQPFPPPSPPPEVALSRFLFLPPPNARRRSRRHSFPYKNDVRRKKNRKKGRRKRPSLLLSSPLNAP